MHKNQNEVTLLLVEDDDVDAISIERSFEQKQIRSPLIRANDGVDALEMLRNGTVQKPYVILLDLQMPRMNGLEFLTKIRADDKLKDSVVFVLTTSLDESDIAASYLDNIAGYFVKEETGDGFVDIVDLLDGYWKVTHLPMKAS